MVNLSDLSGGGSSGGSSSVAQSGWAGGTKPAKYILASNNSSNSAYEFILYDQDFNVIIPAYENYNDQRYKSFTPIVRLGDSSHGYHQSFRWDQWQRTQATPSSNSSPYFNGTSSTNTAWGPAWLDVFADGAYGNNETSYLNKKYLNNHFINSDHTDSSKMYFYYNTKVCCYNRSQASIYSPTAANCRSWSPPTADGESPQDMYHVASYNKTRKEFIGIFYSQGNFNWKVWHYKGVDFDTYPSPHDAFTNATTATWFPLALNSNPSQTSNETLKNLHPVLCDDGTCHLVIFDHSYNLKRYSFTVPQDGTDLTSSGGGTAVSATLQYNFSVTTSYGIEQGAVHGSNQIESGDRKSVAVWSPYYYYNSGVRAFYLPKASTTHSVARAQNNSSSTGHQIMPFRDDGFVAFESGNVYAGNPTGSYLYNAAYRDSGGMTAQSNWYKYLPMFPSPNTTNYPAMSAVNDYWCHPYKDLR